MIAIKKSLIIALSTIGCLFSSQAMAHYHAAGVLPYAYDSKGNIKVLMGLSSVHGDQASDFGGLRDDIDALNPIRTAAREGCEELMFIYDPTSSFKGLLELRNLYGKGFNLFKATSATYTLILSKLTPDCPFSVSSKYCMYFINISYQEDLPKLFLKRKAKYKGLLPKCWNETVKLVWEDLEEVLKAIDTPRSFGPVKINGYSLYEPFVQSLKAARDTGILKNLKK